MSALLPLSYNPIDTRRLNVILERYQGKQHHHLVADFEQGLVSATQSSYAVALNSGSAAIHMALRALGIGVGDVVIAPSFTYVATINPILYQGATPVFVDCEKETWNMDPDLLELALKKETEKGSPVKAILVMHNYGMPAQMNRLLQVAATYQLPVIEDAAEAVGSRYNGKQPGTFGKLGILSFNTNKVFTTYGGGALLTSDESLARRVRFMASQARENLPYYEHHEVGYNYLMGALNAAYGLCQLPYLDQEIVARRNIFERYQAALAYLPFQQEPQGHYSNRWLPAVLFDDEKTRHALAAKLADHGYETRPLWRPMHLQPVFKDYPYYGEQLSKQLFERGLCLPAGTTFSEAQQQEVIRLIAE